MNKPNLFIAGVPKGGTTALAALLGQHPDIFLPHKKEPRYYLFRGTKPSEKDPTNPDSCYNETLYTQIFKDSQNFKYRIDATPAYLSDPKAIEAIYQDVPNAKIILMLRDPIERAFSHILFAKLQGYEPKNISFLEILSNHSVALPNGFVRERTYIEMGMYGKQIQNLYKYFNANQVLILTTENFSKNQQECLTQILDFLKLNKFNFNLNIGEKAKSGIIKNRWKALILEKILLARKILPKSRIRKFFGKKWEKAKNNAISKPEISQELIDYLKPVYLQDVTLLKSITKLAFKDWKNFKHD